MIYYMTDLKYNIIFEHLDGSCRNYKGNNNMACRASAWCVGLVINVGLVYAAAYVCVKLSLASAGSGIGEVCKAHCNPFSDICFWFVC